MRLVLWAGLILVPQGTPVEYTDVKFTLPEGYRPIGSGTGQVRTYRRVIGEETGPDVRIAVQALFSKLDPKAPPRPHEVVQQLGLPTNAQIVVSQESWRGFEVPAIDFRFEPQGSPPRFGRVVLLPLELRTFVLVVGAPQSLEEEARTDLRIAAASAVGSTYWGERRVSGWLPMVFLVVGGFVVAAGQLGAGVDAFRHRERAMGSIAFVSLLYVLLAGGMWLGSGVMLSPYLSGIMLLIPIGVGAVQSESKKMALVQLVGFLFCLIAFALLKRSG